MSDEQCKEIYDRCVDCWADVIACFTHDKDYVCQECGCRTPIDKEKVGRKFNLIFRKAFGDKPDKPEDN